MDLSGESLFEFVFYHQSFLLSTLAPAVPILPILVRSALVDFLIAGGYNTTEYHRTKV